MQGQNLALTVLCVPHGSSKLAYFADFADAFFQIPSTPDPKPSHLHPKHSIPST